MQTKRTIFIFLILLCGSFAGYAQKVGVMIMAHGGSADWNHLVSEASQPLSKLYPVSIAWGMADPVTMQNAITALESKGVTKTIAIPLFVSSHSMIIRQTEYLLGQRDTLADPPMPSMDHSGGHTDMAGMHGSASGDMHHMDMKMPHKSDLKQLNIKADVVLTHALDDNDIVAAILLDRIKELSTQPANETLILVAHGPNSESDNREWIADLESLSEKIQRLQEKGSGTGYKQIFGTTVRDDASEPIFNQAKAQLRSLVQQAGHFSNVIVIPVFLSSNGREKAVAERLEGLNFKWNGRTLLPANSRLSDFLMSSVKNAL